MNTINKLLSTVALCIALGIGIQSASADHGSIQHAGNACFPRLFSQIDEFRMSNGGVTNDSTTIKVLNCSINIEWLETEPDPTSITAALNFRELPEDMECIFYTRNHRGALLDSTTTILTPADSGFNRNMGANSVNDIMTPVDDHYAVNHYIQCRVPAEARIFSIRSWY